MDYLHLTKDMFDVQDLDWNDWEAPSAYNATVSESIMLSLIGDTRCGMYHDTIENY